MGGGREEIEVGGAEAALAERLGRSRARRDVVVVGVGFGGDCGVAAAVIGVLAPVTTAEGTAA